MNILWRSLTITVVVVLAILLIGCKVIMSDMEPAPNTEEPVAFKQKRGFKAVHILTIEGPSMIFVGKAALFSAQVNIEAASLPLKFEWTFEDGKQAKGLSTTHTFSEPGMYYVKFNAQNRGSFDTDSIRVRVCEPNLHIGHVFS